MKETDGLKVKSEPALITISEMRGNFLHIVCYSLSEGMRSPELVEGDLMPKSKG